MNCSEISDPNVTAKWTVGGRDYEAPVVNPGDWFGKTWHLSVCISNTGGLHYIVEADNLSDAIDILAESEEHGSIIAIDVDVEGDDYGEPLSDGIELTDEMSVKADKAAQRLGVPRNELWLTLKGNFVEGGCIGRPNMSGQGVWYGTDNLYVEGVEGIANGEGTPFPVMYHAPGFQLEGICPLDYDQWDWNEEAGRFSECQEGQ